MFIKNINFPTFLTLTRLLVAPLVVPVLITSYLPSHFFGVHLLVVSVFMLFSLTDFFDGYLARNNNQVTLLGTMLDPIADKFLMFSTLIALVTVGKVWYLWAIILIGREFFVMALRQFSLQNGFTIRVSSMGKLKTCVQSIWIVAVMLDCGMHGQRLVEGFLLAATLTTSLFSAAQYSKAFMGKCCKT